MRGAAARWLRGAAPCRRPHDSQALVYAGLDRRERQRPTLLPSGTASGAVAALKADTGAFLTAHMAAAGVAAAGGMGGRERRGGGARRPRAHPPSPPPPPPLSDDPNMLEEVISDDEAAAPPSRAGGKKAGKRKGRG